MDNVLPCKKPRKFRAVAYYRHSSHDSQQASIIAQRNCVRRWAIRNGVEIIREFTDNAPSGLADAKRPAFDEMIARIVTGKDDVDYILCFDATRCWRSARHTPLRPFGKPPEAGDWSFRFDFTGGQEKVFQAWLHIASYAPPGKTAPDHKGAIGVRDDGDVEGCEIVVPKAKFSETWQFPVAAVTDDYKTGVYDLVGTVNDNTFRGCETGRVLFLGATGQRSGRNPDVVEITFEFAVGKHREAFLIGDIEVARKGAWEYLWCEYETKVDEDAHRKVRRPVAVHVERVYASGDFSALGI